MSHTFLLGLQVALIVGVGLHLNGYILHNFKAVSLQAHAFHGVVREEANLVNAQLSQDLCAYTIVAFIGTEPQMHVGLYGVIALFL